MNVYLALRSCLAGGGVAGVGTALSLKLSVAMSRGVSPPDEFTDDDGNHWKHFSTRQLSVRQNLVVYRLNLNTEEKNRGY